MTPKEKARELVWKYKLVDIEFRRTYTSKQCALIAVEEIIEVTEHTVDYWYQVRREIELL